MVEAPTTGWGLPHLTHNANEYTTTPGTAQPLTGPASQPAPRKETGTGTAKGSSVSGNMRLESVINLKKSRKHAEFADRNRPSW